MNRTTLLKIKIVSLVDETRTIRKEEEKAKAAENWGLFYEMVSHRKGIIRREVRNTLLAYGYLRGLGYRDIEARSHTPPDWDKVKRMIRSYSDTSVSEQEIDAWMNQPELPKLPLRVLNAA